MSNPNEKSQRTIEILTESGVIPNYVAFDITEEMLEEAIRVYGSLSEGGNKKFDHGLARKIHGLNMLKLKFSRGAKIRDCKEGLVYLIANPAWPEHLKIGMTIDLESRLASYQTYDPFKAYRIKNYEFCLDRRAAEKELLDRFDIRVEEEGEWIRHSDSLGIIKVLRDFEGVPKRPRSSMNRAIGLYPKD